MNKMTKGFTLIELMIVITIFAIISVVVRGATSGDSVAISEMFQRGGTICKAGVLFSIDTHGFQTQVIGPNGGGVACQ